MTSHTPLRSIIADHIIGMIAGGHWKPGEAIPSETQLMEKFGVSRMTVHHSLRDLTSRGFLVRRKGAGSYVAPPSPYTARYAHRDIVDEIEERGGVHSATVLHRGFRLPTGEELEDFAADRLLFHARLVHLDDGRPVELEDRLLDAAAMPGCGDIDLQRQTIFSALMLMRPYREGSESIRPVLPDADERAWLDCDPTEVALEIGRKTRAGDRLVTTVRLLRVRWAARLDGRIACDQFSGPPR